MTHSATESAPQRRRASDDGPAPLLSHAPSRRALCIGIDAYSAAPLKACVADAERWSSALAALGFEVRMLKDRKATRARVEAAIINLLDATQDGGQAIIQFAGHATQLPDPTAPATHAWTEALVPIDYLTAGCIASADLAALLLPHADRLNITLFFDCSHPGSVPYPAVDVAQADGDAIAANVAETAALRRRYLPLASQLATALVTRQPPLQSARSHAVLTVPHPASRWVHVAAARPGEFAFESAEGGNFSLAALRHLPTAIKERWLPARFIDAVRTALPANRAQTPQVHPIAGRRSGQALLGNLLTEPSANAVAKVNSLSLRELIRAVDALSVDAPESGVGGK